jgi:hypothetical protein
MTRTLEDLIGVFAEDRRVWQEPEKARNQCTEASNEFIKYLRCHGIEAQLIEIDPGREFPELYPEAKPMAEGDPVHHVVKVGGYIIDWTIKQYNPQAEYPTIIKDPQPNRRPHLTIEGGGANLMGHIRAAKSPT